MYIDSTQMVQMGIMPDAERLQDMSIASIARLIRRDWRQPYFGALPYIDAMLYIDSISDSYGADDARGIVMYFLSNAAQWRGPVAKAVKTELKRRAKVGR